MAAARALKIASFALCVSTVAVQLPSVLDPSPSAATAATSAEAPPFPPLDGAVLKIFPPLIVMEVLFVAVPFLYRHGHRRAAAMAADGAGAGNRRLPESELLAFALCVVVGLLQHFLLAQPASGGATDGGAQARALGLAALRVLPASTAATFFLGLALVYAHVAGGDNGPVPEHAMRILSEITLEAAAALIGITVMVVCCSS